ncbi:MAG TPA: L,D-transpeptidase family protein [Novosphingobium sp.]|nr:L,D-transpeptidase family protein [Novosphingobium sp.]
MTSLAASPAFMQPAFAAPAKAKARAGAVKKAPSAAPVDPATAMAVREEAGGKIGKFYQARGYRPLWTTTRGNIGTAARELLGYLDEAELDGLKPSRYGPDDLRAAVARADRGGPQALAEADVALTRAFVRYVGDMRRAEDVGMTYVGKGLKPGKLSDDAILRVAALKNFGDYVGAMGWMSPHYVRMRDMLRRAEATHADRGTLEVLRLNVERARVLPSPAVRHIVVDAAAARLYYYQDGAQVGTMRVVVGAEKTQTPMLAGYVNWAIFNPYWNIPDYLTRDNVARKVLSGRTLKSMDMEVLSDWSATPQVVDPSTVDWQAVRDGRQEVRIRELPGPANSMGKVKFLFPNDEGIYLHDTPNRDLLVKDDRHLSNGCIRLEDAPALGRWMMGKAFGVKTKAPEQAVPLPAPVPVYLTYLTATPTKKGVALLDDVYGRDGRKGL